MHLTHNTHANKLVLPIGFAWTIGNIAAQTLSHIVNGDAAMMLTFGGNA